MKKENSNILEKDPLDFKGEFTEDQQKALDDFKSQSWAEPVKKEVEKPKDEDTDEDKKTDDEESEDDDTDKDKKKEDAEEDEESEEKEDDEDSDEDEDSEEDSDDESKKDDKKGEEDEEAVIRKIAEEDKMSLDEAKEAYTKDKSLVERHGNDPLKIARALRKENQSYSLAQNKIKELEKFKSDVEEQQLKYSEQMFERNIETQRDDIIEAYIKKHPDQSELSEDAIFERAKNQIKKAIEGQREQRLKEVSEKAKVRREELMNEIPEEYSEVAPEVKEVLKDMDDTEIVSSDFDISYILNWARGKKYTPEYIKSLKEAEYKRGKEEPKIKKKKSIESDSRRTPLKKVHSASPKDRERALEMFGRREGWTEEQMVEEYMTNHKGKDFFD